MAIVLNELFTAAPTLRLLTPNDVSIRGEIFRAPPYLPVVVGQV
jgi:hypothetical protein